MDTYRKNALLLGAVHHLDGFRQPERSAFGATPRATELAHQRRCQCQPGEKRRA